MQCKDNISKMLFHHEEQHGGAVVSGFVYMSAQGV